MDLVLRAKYACQGAWEFFLAGGGLWAIVQIRSHGLAIGACFELGLEGHAASECGPGIEASSLYPMYE